MRNELLPVRFAVRPALHFFEILGTIGQLIGAPGEEKHVLGGSQREDARVDLLQAKNDQPGSRAA